MKRLPSIPIKPPIKGINRFSEEDKLTCAEALDVYTDNNFEVRRRPAFKSVTTGAGIRIAVGNTQVVTREAGTLIAWASHCPQLDAGTTELYVGSFEKFNALRFGEVFGLLPNPGIPSTQGLVTADLSGSGTAWNSIQILDKTIDYYRGEGVTERRSLAKTGMISWHITEEAYSNWTSRTIGNISLGFGYWVRFTIPTTLPFLSTLGSPGISIIQLNPVVSIIPSIKQQLLIGDDDNTRIRKRPSSSLGVTTSIRYSPLQAVLTEEIGGCTINAVTAPTIKTVALATTTGRDWPSGANYSTPGWWVAPAALGDAGLVDKLDRRFSSYWRNDVDTTLNTADEWRGGPLHIDLENTLEDDLSVTVDVDITSINEGEFNGCMLQVIDTGEEREVYSTDSSTGEIKFFPEMSTNIGIGDSVRINRPNATLLLTPSAKDFPEVRDPHYSVQNNAENSLAFYDFEPAPGADPTAFGIGGLITNALAGYKLGWEFPWKFFAGDFWTSCIDPVTGNLLLANGKCGVVQYNGTTFTQYTPLFDEDDPTVIAFLGILPRVNDEDLGSRKQSINPLRRHFPNLPILALFNGVIVMAGENRVIWSRPEPNVNMWPNINERVIKDAENTPITTLQSLGNRLIVSTATAIFSSVPIDENGMLNFQPESQGFGLLSHQATSRMVFSGQPAIVGPTAQGVVVYNGVGEPVYVLDQWETVIREGVNTARLKYSAGAFSRSRNEYFLAFTPSGESANTRLLVWNVGTNSFWVWTAPFGGISSIAVDQRETGEEIIYFGFQDGHVGVLNNAGSDDSESNPINAFFRTHPLAPDDLAQFQPALLQIQANAVSGVETTLYGNRSGDVYAQATNDFTEGVAQYGTATFNTTPLYGGERLTKQVRIPTGEDLEIVQLEVSGETQFKFYGAQLQINPLGYNIKAPT